MHVLYVGAALHDVVTLYFVCFVIAMNFVLASHHVPTYAFIIQNHLDCPNYLPYPCV